MARTRILQYHQYFTDHRYFSGYPHCFNAEGAGLVIAIPPQGDSFDLMVTLLGSTYLRLILILFFYYYYFWTVITLPQQSPKRFAAVPRGAQSHVSLLPQSVFTRDRVQLLRPTGWRRYQQCDNTLIPSGSVTAVCVCKCIKTGSAGLWARPFVGQLQPPLLC